MTGAERRTQTKSIIALPVAIMGLQWLLIIAAPGYMGPESPFAWAWPLVPLAMQATGLTWMVRIYWTATHVEPDHGNWRYRD